MNRLTEPSTYAGLGLFIQSAKLFLGPSYHPYIDALSAACGAFAVKLPEKTAQQ